MFAVLLFVMLDGKRRSASAPPVRMRLDDALGAPSNIPPLVVPAEPVSPTRALQSAPISVVPTPVPTPPRFAPPQQRVLQMSTQPTPIAPVAQAPALKNEPALVIDVGTPSTSSATNPDQAAASGGNATTGGDARASIMRHRSTTVAQGTLIPAVLETALDSTRAGLARAVVARDVRGFDGSQILIPRGSRLFGEYRSDTQAGQNRALIIWTRLLRPDGATIAIGSPVSDTLGRAGLRGKVNSHFFARFGATILQSTLDLGVNLASRINSNNSPVIVALPGAASNLAQPLTQGAQIQPTLRVAQGKSLSVFVSRDLDFTAVESGK